MVSKKLTLGALKTLDSKKFTQRKLVLENGKFEVLVDEVFRESKIKELMEEVLEKAEYMKNNEIKMNLGVYSTILIIKYFTDIEVPNDFNAQIQFFKSLDDHNYLEIILNAFNEKEIKNLTNKIYEYGSNIKKFIEEFKKENQVENNILENIE